ncbi:MAG: hydrolase Nlp/P60 [Flavobacteriia bacterium]|nr:MAG: hydrolase Nlp/P60 [Flavobacteriia bacterium]
MEYGICILIAIPLRKEPDDCSEMISQVLFGETFKITESESGFLKITTDYDQYEGWLAKNQITELNTEEYQRIINAEKVYCGELINFISEQDNSLTLISLGAILCGIQNHNFTINNTQYFFEGENLSGNYNKKKIIQTAYLYLNTPFLWGGRTPLGIDCSGFTQMVYKINGHYIPRDAAQQAQTGEVLSFIEESEPGDLAFFDDEEGNIIHTGIILANNHIIHSYGKVRIDQLDQSGIFNNHLKRHTHKLRVIKKIF